MRISDWSSDVCSSDLLSPEQKPKLLATTNKDYEEIRERHANKDRQEKFVTLDEARANRTPIDWAGYRPPRPRLLLQQRSEEHTSELQSLMRNSYAVFCLNKQKTKQQPSTN